MRKRLNSTVISKNKNQNDSFFKYEPEEFEQYDKDNYIIEYIDNNMHKPFFERQNCISQTKSLQKQNREGKPNVFLSTVKNLSRHRKMRKKQKDVQNQDMKIQSLELRLRYQTQMSKQHENQKQLKYSFYEYKIKQKPKLVNQKNISMIEGLFKKGMIIQTKQNSYKQLQKILRLRQNIRIKNVEMKQDEVEIKKQLINKNLKKQIRNSMKWDERIRYNIKSSDLKRLNDIKMFENEYNNKNNIRQSFNKKNILKDFIRIQNLKLSKKYQIKQKIFYS